jgi:hypothetical protein
MYHTVDPSEMLCGTRRPDQSQELEEIQSAVAGKAYYPPPLEFSAEFGSSPAW